MTQLWPAEIELAYMDAQVCKASARGICPNSLSGAYSRYFPRAPITLVVLDSPFENPLTLASILRVVNSQQGRSIAAQDPTATQLCRPMRGLLITIPKVPTLPAHHSVIYRLSIGARKTVSLQESDFLSVFAFCNNPPPINCDYIGA